MSVSVSARTCTFLFLFLLTGLCFCLVSVSAVSVSAKFLVYFESCGTLPTRGDGTFFIIIVVCIVHVHYFAPPQCKSLLEPFFSERRAAPGQWSRISPRNLRKRPLLDCVPARIAYKLLS